MSGAAAYVGLIKTKTCAGGTLTSATVMATAGESTGTGYARQSVTLGTAANGIISVPTTTWNPGAQTDWPTDVSAFFLASASSAGICIYLWDLVGGPFSLTTDSNLVIPAANYFFENPGGI